MQVTPVSVKGFFRVQIGDGPDGRLIVGDSGWVENVLTTEGLNNYIAACVGKSSGSKQYQYFQLATQTAAVVASATSLLGEVYTRTAMSPSTIATGTFQATAAWASGSITAATAIAALGLYDVDAAGTVGAGQTFNASTIATNQAISVTYQLRFAQG